MCMGKNKAEMQNMRRNYCKGYPRLLAHTTTHYTTSELLYNEEADENIIFINFESSKISNEIYSENGYDYALRCRICEDRFTFKKEEITLSKLVDHIKSHYIDKDLVKKEWIAKDIIYLNYDSVLQLTKSHNSGRTTYRDLTERAMHIGTPYTV
jgi:hypothetical protein